MGNLESLIVLKMHVFGILGKRGYLEKTYRHQNNMQPSVWLNLSLEMINNDTVNAFMIN